MVFKKILNNKMICKILKILLLDNLNPSKKNVVTKKLTKI